MGWVGGADPGLGEGEGAEDRRSGPLLPRPVHPPPAGPLGEAAAPSGGSGPAEEQRGAPGSVAHRPCPPSFSAVQVGQRPETRERWPRSHWPRGCTAAAGTQACWPCTLHCNWWPPGRGTLAGPCAGPGLLQGWAPPSALQCPQLPPSLLTASFTGDLPGAQQTAVCSSCFPSSCPYRAQDGACSGGISGYR